MVKDFRMLAVLICFLVVFMLVCKDSTQPDRAWADSNTLLSDPAPATGVEFNIPGMMEKKKDKSETDTSKKSRDTAEADSDEDIESDCCARLSRLVRTQQDEINEMKRIIRELRATVTDCCDKSQRCCRELEGENTDLRNTLRRLESKIADIEARCCH